MPQAPTSLEALDRFGIDAFCDAIVDGENYITIARRLEIGASAIHRWLALDEVRAARVREANIVSAHTSDAMAEAALLNTQLDPARARELASHYRWRAKVRNRREYGDEVKIDQTAHITTAADSEVLAQLEATRAAIAKLEGEREEGAGDASDSA